MRRSIIKKTAVFLAVLIIGTAILTGCAGTSKEADRQTLRVYSVCGENNELSVSNGVIVVNKDEETFDGGQVEVKLDTDNINGYSMRFYILRPDGEKEPVFVKSVSDGMGQDDYSDMGQIRGDGAIPGDIQDAVDDFYFELKAEDMDGNRHEYDLKLEVKRII